LGAFFAAVRQKTGLSAPIQRILLCKIRKDFRFYPLRAKGLCALRFFENKRIGVKP
jgi:hypothetical protein